MSELEKVKKLHEEGKIGYVTIDTSILEKYIHEPTSGMCRLLSKFKLHGITLTLSSIVRNELIKHKVDEYEEKREKAKSGLNAVKKFINIQPYPYDDLIDKIESQDTLKQASALLEDFEDITECETLGLESVQTDEIYDKYFQQKPPFGKKQDKKHEFPDAAALISFRNLADKEGKYIVVVAKDNDWKGFCEENECLIYIDDLDGLLTLFDDQDALKHMESYIDNRLDNLSDKAFLERSIRQYVSERVEEMKPISDSCLSYRYEILDNSIVLDDFNIIQQIQSLSLESGLYTFEIELEIFVNATALFYFFVRDNEMREDTITKDSHIHTTTSGAAVISIDVSDFVHYENNKPCINTNSLAGANFTGIEIVDISVYISGFSPSYDEVERTWLPDSDTY
ncbi:MAG: PIN domain-containing protein [Deferribacterales bacterium]